MSFKKTVLTTVLTAAIALCPWSACFAAITTEVTETQVKIMIDLGESVAGKKIGVEVVNPSKNIDDLSSADSADLMDAFAFIRQTTANAEGKADIVYTPTGESGWYTVNVGYESAEDIETARFIYVRQQEIDELMTKLKESNDVADVRDVFAEPEGDELAGYYILGLHETEVYDIFDTASSATKESIYKRLLAEVKNAEDTADVKNVFSAVVLSERLFSITDTDELKEYIEDNDEKMGFTASDIYNGIYMDSTLCGSKTKTKVLKAIIDHEWTDDAKADVVGTCEEIIFLTALYNENVYDRIGEMIDAAEDMLIANGADLDGMADVKSETDVYRSIAGEEYSDISDFVSALNDAIDDNSKGSSGGGSGSGSSKKSSGGGSGGTNVSIPGGTGAVNPLPQLESRFSDLDGAQWASEAIEYLAEQGIVSGKSANKFYPADNMTRAEFAKVLVLSFDISDAGAKVDFTDVNPEDWYYTYVASAYAKGIIKGYGDSFGANDFITRQDMATIVCRAMEATGKKAEALREYTGFADEEQIAEYALESVKTLYSAEIINGMSDDIFAPLDYATRAQIAKIMYGLLVGQEG